MSLSAAARRKAPLVALIPLGVALLVIWSLGTWPAGGPARTAGALPAAAVLLTFLLTFGALALNWLDRLAAVAVGTVAVLAIGAAVGFYTPADALRYLWQRRDPLGLVAGIGMVTELLREGGVFGRLAQRAVAAAGSATPRSLMVRLCLLTFVLSLCLNNLATMMVLVPLTLRVSRALELDVVPLVVAEVIASNLGGASTMIGDLPNMIIASASGLGLGAFCAHLAPICLMQLVLVLWLAPAPAAPAWSTARLRLALRQLDAEPYDAAVARRAALIFGTMLVGFVVASLLGLRLGLVALCFGHLAMFAGGVPWRRLTSGVLLQEVLFFACLFVIAGSVHAAGTLDGLGSALAALLQQRPLWGALALAGAAALLATLVSAGPATALLVHLLPARVVAASPSTTLWWALSLGICAGSSGTLTGATAGPVAAGLLERQGVSLSFNRFARTGLPLMLLLLASSSAYLALSSG